MSETIRIGLLLLIVGMGTVFCVLLIVIGTGKLLIQVANRWLPARESEEIPPNRTGNTSAGPQIAVLTATVHAVTGGRGEITHIERLE